MTTTIWFDQKVFDLMREWADMHFPNEVGGMLVGYEADTGDVVVKEVIGPGPQAIHRPTRFEPDARYQQAQLEERFAKSDGVHTYVGDWHTHPRGVSELSSTDRQTLARIANVEYECTNTPTMVILAGGSDSPWLVGAHRVKKGMWRPWGTKTIIEQLSVKLFT